MHFVHVLIHYIYSYSQHAVMLLAGYTNAKFLQFLKNL